MNWLTFLLQSARDAAGKNHSDDRASRERKTRESIKLQREIEKLEVEIVKIRHDDERASPLLKVEQGKHTLAQWTLGLTFASVIIAAATFYATSKNQSNQFRLLQEQNRDNAFNSLVQQFDSIGSANTRLAAATGLEAYTEDDGGPYRTRTLQLLVLSMNGEEAASVRDLVGEILVRHPSLDSLKVLYGQNRTLQDRLAVELGVDNREFIGWNPPFCASPTDAQKKTIALLEWNADITAQSLMKTVEWSPKVTSKLSPTGVMLSLPNYLLDGSPAPSARDQWELPNVGVIRPLQPDPVRPPKPVGFTDREFVEVHFSRCKLSNVRFRHCTFTGCTFDGAVLDGAVFDDCRFHGGSVVAYRYWALVDHRVDIGRPPTWKHCKLNVNYLWPKAAYDAGAGALPDKLIGTECLLFTDKTGWTFQAPHPDAKPHFECPLVGYGELAGSLK